MHTIIYFSSNDPFSPAISTNQYLFIVWRFRDPLNILGTKILIYKSGKTKRPQISLRDKRRQCLKQIANAAPGLSPPSQTFN